MSANRVVHALMWITLSLCVCGCDPSAVMAVAGPSLDAGPALVAAVPVVKDSLTTDGDATVKESLQVRSPDCDCESCQCQNCCCGDIPVPAEAEKPAKVESVPKLLDPAKYPSIVANDARCFDVLIEVPHPSQGDCPHCHRWLGDYKGAKSAASWDIQKAGYTVGVIHDPAWGNPDPLPRIWVSGRLAANGYLSADQILRMLPAKVNAAEPPKAAATSAPSGPPVARVKVGNTSAGGVVIGPGKVLTASHVVHAGWPHAVEIDGKTYPATVIKDDAESDLACVSYEGPTVPSIAVAQSEPAEGTAATAYGFPAGGAQQKHATTLSRRWGNFAAVGLYHSRSPFVPGDSGGPVVNAAGELVGIVTGTDTKIGVGLVVDQPSIVAFLGDSAR